MDDHTKKTERVRKLVWLATRNASSNEATSAALMACKLIMEFIEHNIELRLGPDVARPRGDAEKPRAPRQAATQAKYAATRRAPDPSRRPVRVRQRCFCSECGVEIQPSQIAAQREKKADRICIHCHANGNGYADGL